MYEIYLYSLIFTLLTPPPLPQHYKQFLCNDCWGVFTYARGGDIWSILQNLSSATGRGVQEFSEVGNWGYIYTNKYRGLLDRRKEDWGILWEISSNVEDWSLCDGG